MIVDNLKEVEARINAACERAHRDPSEVTLIAVSKTKPVSDIEQVLSTSVRDFGENKVQELTSKYEVLPKDLRWHMIGHLQRNKVKYIVDKVVLIHSVDSLRLAQQISEEAVKHDVHVNILIEVNVADESTKFGTTSDACIALIQEVAKLPGITIKGLMTIAPFVDNPEDNRIHFRNLKQLFVDINSKNIDNVNMSVLSMGMTGDYEVAIEEGATMVRVGTGIFGERTYHV